MFTDEKYLKALLAAIAKGILTNTLFMTEFGIKFFSIDSEGLSNRTIYVKKKGSDCSLSETLNGSKMSYDLYQFLHIINLAGDLDTITEKPDDCAGFAKFILS